MTRRTQNVNARFKAEQRSLRNQCIAKDAEIARLRADLEHEKKQRAFNDRHLERMDCGAFRTGIAYDESTCDPAKPCIRCARAKELARLRAVIHEAHKERDDYIDQAYGSGTAEKPCPCEHCARHRASKQETKT